MNERILAAMMVGKEVLLDALDREDRGETETAVEVRDLQALDNRGLPAVRGVSLTVRRGEILGIAGIEGNGQSELIEAITGMRPLRGGSGDHHGQVHCGENPRGDSRPGAGPCARGPAGHRRMRPRGHHR